MTEEAALHVEVQDSAGDWRVFGTITHDRGVNRFHSDPGYWEALDRPVVGQQFEENSPQWQPAANGSLPTWFSHLLPEGLLRRVVAEAAGVNEQREFFLLRQIGGEDLPGALRVRPATHDASHGEIDLEGESSQAPKTAQLKFSLAGLQLKFSLVDSAEKGLSLPAAGEAGTYIAKLPDRRAGYEGVPQAEFAALSLAKSIGVNTAEAELISASEIDGLPEWAVAEGDIALIVRRFDRRQDGRRCHMEEFAQVLGISNGNPDFKYERANFETVLRVANELAGTSAAQEVVDRLVLNILLGNGDAHTKNWAILYPDSRTPQLAPAYDIVPTVLFVPHDDLGMNLAGSKAFASVGRRELLRLAEKAGVTDFDVIQRAAHAVEAVVDNWGVLGESLPVAMVNRLTEHRDRTNLRYL